MAFYLFKKENEKNYRRIGEIKLAGRKAIYNLWLKKGSPLDNGWLITQDDLLKEVTSNNEHFNDFRIIIDFYPSSKDRIELIEILEIYPYTYGNVEGSASWSVLMLRVRDFWKTYHGKKIELSERDKLLENITCDKSYEGDIFEFLYLQGEENGWVPGRVGFVNAAFIHKPARDYFKKWFCA